jgi:hypothetical protein
MTLRAALWEQRVIEARKVHRAGHVLPLHTTTAGTSAAPPLICPQRSLADIFASPDDVRFTQKNQHRAVTAECPLSADHGHITENFADLARYLSPLYLVIAFSAEKD